MRAVSKTKPAVERMHFSTDKRQLVRQVNHRRISFVGIYRSGVLGERIFPTERRNEGRYKSARTWRHGDGCLLLERGEKVRRVRRRRQR
jgi:hypothetical protein